MRIWLRLRNFLRSVRRRASAFGRWLVTGLRRLASTLGRWLLKGWRFLAIPLQTPGGRLGAIALLIAVTGGVLVSFKRPQVSATVPMSGAYLTTREDLGLGNMAEAIKVLEFSGFEDAALPAGGRCSSPKADGKLALTAGTVERLYLGRGDWSFELIRQGASSIDGALLIKSRSTSSTVEAYVDLKPNAVAKPENCASPCKGNETNERQPSQGSRISVRADSRRASNFQIYVSFSKLPSGALLEAVCVDAIGGKVASKWELQRQYWETCVLDSQTELRNFNLMVNANCPPAEARAATLRPELGGVRLEALRLSGSNIEAKFRWPDQAAWGTDIEPACTYTFWDRLTSPFAP